MKEILVTGSTGLVGSRFVELNKDHHLLTPTHQELDITDTDSVNEYTDAHKPSLILNFAAYTNVSEAENQTGDNNSPCWQINVNGVKNLLETKLPFIQISTDMIFSGSEEDPGPYEENHHIEEDPHKLTWYGWAKNQAEREVIAANQTIVRIIYPVRAHFDQKLDYLRSPLQLFKQGRLYPLFDDQQVSFTFIDELVTVLNLLIEDPKTGTFHVSSNTFTPYELVAYAVRKLGADPSAIKTHSIRPFLEKQANPYRYPVKGGLLTSHTERKLSIKFRTWPDVVDELVDQGLSLTDT